MQVIGYEPLPDPSTGRLYDVQAAYGSMRAYLNPWKGGDPASQGNYLHGQAANGPGYTHGCLCYGQDPSIINYLWDLGQKVPVALDVPAEQP